MDNLHYRKQLDYYKKEFSAVLHYELAAWQRSYIQRIKEYLLDNDFRNKTLLDIATGSGYVAVEMARYGVNVIACDMSEQAIANLKKYKKQFSLKNLELLVCKAEDIPLADNSVDYIVANAILEHIPDENQAVLEWKRILRRNGKMFITVPLSLKHIWPFLWFINILYDKRLGHLRRYDLESLKNIFKLKIIKIFYTGHIIKVLGVLILTLFKIDKLDRLLEKIDQKKENNRYGANNICVILEK